jgi:tRNA threonylcarbamoyladenosine biosynthesis protein TsaB
MTLLAIDTSGEYAVVALADERGVVKASAIFEGRRTLSRRLLSVVDRLLTENSLTLTDVSGFAVGIGPGSFTGLRVGLTTMKTFAQVTDKPIVGINTLDAYAFGIRSEAIIVATPSRRGELYAATYGSGLDQAPFAESVEALSQRCRELSQERALVLCGDSKSLTELGIDAVARVDRRWTSPEGMTALAAERLATGQTDNPISLVPLYVVPPAISTPRDTSILPAQK